MGDRKNKNLNKKEDKDKFFAELPKAINEGNIWMGDLNKGVLKKIRYWSNPGREETKITVGK